MIAAHALIIFSEIGFDNLIILSNFFYTEIFFYTNCFVHMQRFADFHRK